MISIVDFILHSFTDLLTGYWLPPGVSWACWTEDPPWPPRAHWSGSPHLYCHSAACCVHLYSQCALQRWGQTVAGYLCWLCGPHRRRSCHNQHPRALSGSGPEKTSCSETRQSILGSVLPTKYAKRDIRETWDWPETDLRLTWEWPETDLKEKDEDCVL